MKFEFTPPQTGMEEFFGGYFRIHALGPILPGDDERFLEFLKSSGAPPRSDLFIDSGGGYVEAAINMGRIVRDSWFSTHIGTAFLNHDEPRDFITTRNYIPGKCISAATLVFIGGRLRYHPEGSKFGVHQFSFKNPTPDFVSRSQILSAKIARYIADMGISSEFLEISSATESTKINTLGIDELTRLNIVTGPETAASWTIHAAENGLYARGERDGLYGHHKIILSYIKPHGFSILAVIESQGREEELVNFPLVELVISLENEHIIPINSRCRRHIFGIYTNIDAAISVREAQMIARSRGVGLRVRSSPEAEIFLGIDTMDTAAGQHLLQAMAHNLA